jgi:hypothetical protein
LNNDRYLLCSTKIDNDYGQQDESAPESDHI